MIIKSLALTSVGLALVAAPVAVNAAPANKATTFSVSKSTRTGTATTKKNKFVEGGVIIIAAAAVAVGGALYLAIDDNSDSN